LVKEEIETTKIVTLDGIFFASSYNLEGSWADRLGNKESNHSPVEYNRMLCLR
jgi:hypothetical protein